MHRIRRSGRSGVGSKEEQVRKPIWLLVAAITFAAIFSATSAVGDEEEGGAHAESVCSKGSTYSLAIMPEIGLSLETEISPASTTRMPLDEEGASAGVNRVRELWSIKLIYNDIVVMDKYLREKFDGVFLTRVVMGNLEGADHLEMQATNVDSGETCWGTVQAEF
jgi:hypothetical protein